MKRSQLILATLALPVDYAMLVAAGLLAYQARFWGLVTGYLPVQFSIAYPRYVATVFLMAAVWVGLFAVVGLYRLHSQLKLSQEVAYVGVACTAGLATIVLLFFFNPQLFGSRFIVLTGWVFACLLATLGRLLLRQLRAALYRTGYAVTRVAIIGRDASSRALVELFRRHPELGFRVTSELPEAAPAALALASGSYDEVVIGDPSVPRQQALQVLQFCHTHHLGFRYVADLFEAQAHNVVAHTLAGLPLIEIRRTPLEGWGRVAKRACDGVLSLLALVALAPLLALVALAVLLTTGWPPVIALTRVGEGGGTFRLYKFRSMVQNAHLMKPELEPFNERVGGPLFKMAHDPRVTQMGVLLRRTSLDELPQLWNVLRGEMSLVGPRPHEPGEVSRYQAVHRKLLNIKPGITGLAQVSGRSDLAFEDEAKLDTFYVENWSLGQDFVILVKTMVVVLQRRSAV